MKKRASSQPYSYYSSAPLSELRQPAPKHRPAKLRKGLFCIILGLIIVLGMRFTVNKGLSIEHVKAHDAEVTPHDSSSANPASLSSMSNQINKILSQNSDIDISVSLVDLSNDQAQHYGDSTGFTAASVAKVLTAVYFLHEVESRQASLSETINGNSAQYELEQMIVVSDDNAWEALNNELGYTNMSAYATSIGVNYDWQNNVLTSVDMATLLQKLWSGQLLNVSDTTLLLSYMQQANYRDFIVPVVPAGDKIYHKVGLYDDSVNEAAIITNGHQAFAIVIFTNGNGVYDWSNRAQIMQSITKVALATYF